MSVIAHGRTDSLHGVAVHFQRHTGAGLRGIAVRIGQVQVGDGTGAVQVIFWFGAHELGPLEIFPLGGSAGDFHFKLGRGQRCAGQFTFGVQNDLRDVRAEIEHFGDGRIMSARRCAFGGFIFCGRRFFVIFESGRIFRSCIVFRSCLVLRSCAAIRPRIFPGGCTIRRYCRILAACSVTAGTKGKRHNGNQ